MPNTLAGVNKLVNSDSILGQTFPVMIEMYSDEDATFVVSRRKYLQSLIPNAIKELKCNETVYTGVVTGTTDFGVFVEFNNCLTGMIHKTNIDPDWAEKIKSIPAGFEIQFYVKEIIKDNKIILTQILRDSLWDVLEIHQILNAKVIEYKTSGLLVALDSETVGVIPNNELDKIDREFNSGQNIKVKINNIDRSNRKIYLSVA
jgi:ribosomal protein S1